MTKREPEDWVDCRGDSGSWILHHSEIMDETRVIKIFAQTSASHGLPSVQLQTERQPEISSEIRKLGENIRRERRMTVLIGRRNLKVSFRHLAKEKKHLRVVRSFQHTLVLSLIKCLIGSVLFVAFLAVVVKRVKIFLVAHMLFLSVSSLEGEVRINRRGV